MLSGKFLLDLVHDPLLLVVVLFGVGGSTIRCGGGSCMSLRWVGVICPMPPSPRQLLLDLVHRPLLLVVLPGGPSSTVCCIGFGSTRQLLLYLLLQPLLLPPPSEPIILRLQITINYQLYHIT